MFSNILWGLGIGDWVDAFLGEVSVEVYPVVDYCADVRTDPIVIGRQIPLYRPGQETAFSDSPYQNVGKPCRCIPEQKFGDE